MRFNSFYKIFKLFLGQDQLLNFEHWWWFDCFWPKFKLNKNPASLKQYKEFYVEFLFVSPHLSKNDRAREEFEKEISATKFPFTFIPVPSDIGWMFYPVTIGS